MKRKKIMEEVLIILRRRSIKSLKLARKQLSMLQIEENEAREALKDYAKYWNDTTHPGIISIICDAVGGTPEDAVPMQVAMLLLTAAIDIHDDILDQTLMKNGKPTIYGKFGKDTALLLGDALLVESFILLNKYGYDLPKESFKAVIENVETFIFEVGNAHLLEAALKEKLSISPEKYMEILKKKASIMAGLAKIGAIVGNGSIKEIEAFGEYGKILGILIAIREEFVDLFEIDELRNRLKTGCLPLPILYALDDPTVNNILSMLDSDECVPKLIEAIFGNHNVKNLKRLMHNLADQALSIVDQLKLQNQKIIKELRLLVQGTLEDL
jgi:geranylgeranyl diphosphate synthase type I